MAAVSTYSPTGIATTDGILSGTAWAGTSLTYSFPSGSSLYEYSGERDSNFNAFTPIQQDAARRVLANFSSVSNLTFTEVTETSTQHATLRYAESDSPSTAWAYYPSTSVQGGDAWFNNSSHYYDAPMPGNYAYLTILHETGHALGLKHAHEVNGSFGAVPLEYDSLEYTVMSYRSYVGGPTTGYTLGSTSYPQTLMMLDIAAIQTTYGANYNTNASNTVYSWSPTTGEMFIDGTGQGAPAGNRVFMTIWDGGGQDTYDFSNYTGNLSINLQPGQWSTVSAVQLAVLGGGHYAAGNIANALLYNNNPASLIENAIGGRGADTIVGNIANNHLTGGDGNDVLDGAEGTDTAIYWGLSGSYSVLHNADGSWTVTDLGGTYEGADTLWSVEFLQFADTIVTLDASAPTGGNTAPVFTSGAQSVQLTEWSDNSANELANAAHTSTGTLTFSDADAGDLHVVSFGQHGTGYIGTFAVSGVNDANGTVGWSFSVADSAMDYLKAGQSLTQTYDIVLDDGHGGTSLQSVTITLLGTDDAVVRTRGGGVGGSAGKGKGGGNDAIALGAPDAAFDVEHDQAPAPLPERTYLHAYDDTFLFFAADSKLTGQTGHGGQGFWGDIA
jgi:serralysin